MSYKKPTNGMTAKRYRFAQLVVGGENQSNAYRKAFGRPAWPDAMAADKGSKLAKVPCVAELIANLRDRVDKKTLLTLNDRLAILADIAQTRGKSPGHLAAKTRAVDVYSKISGDQAPMRIENTGKDGGPIAVAATVALNVTRVPVRERIRLLKEARERERAADAAANPGK